MEIGAVSLAGVPSCAFCYVMHPQPVLGLVVGRLDTVVAACCLHASLQEEATPDQRAVAHRGVKSTVLLPTRHASGLQCELGDITRACTVVSYTATCCWDDLHLLLLIHPCMAWTALQLSPITLCSGLVL